jgi:hypothetical protein
MQSVFVVKYIYRTLDYVYTQKDIILMTETILAY